MAQFNYADLVGRILSTGGDERGWAVARARAFMLAVYIEALTAAEQLRTRGTILDVSEFAGIGDTVELTANLRAFRFRREGQVVNWHAEAVPSRVLKTPTGEVNLPNSEISDIGEIARKAVQAAVKHLFTP